MVGNHEKRGVNLINFLSPFEYSTINSVSMRAHQLSLTHSLAHSNFMRWCNVKYYSDFVYKCSTEHQQWLKPCNYIITILICLSGGCFPFIFSNYAVHANPLPYGTLCIYIQLLCAILSCYVSREIFRSLIHIFHIFHIFTSQVQKSLFCLFRQ